MVDLFNPAEVPCLGHYYKTEFFVKTYGKDTLKCRQYVAERWQLDFSDPRLDENGYFQNTNTVLDIQHQGCSATIMVAEATPTRWCMTTYHTYPGFPAIRILPSIWEDEFYTSEENASVSGIAPLLYKFFDLKKDSSLKPYHGAFDEMIHRLEDVEPQHIKDFLKKHRA